MKIVKSSCSSKRKVRTCTFSPQVNIKNKRTAIQTEQDVNAAHSEAKIQDLIDDIRSNIYTKVKAVATSSDFGFDENEIDDYFFVEASAAEIGEDHHEAIRVEVRAEVSYEGLEDLMEALNPIIETYDSYAYFEPVEPGIIEAYVSVNQVDMSIYGATASPDHMFYEYHGKRFSVHDNSSQIRDDVIEDVYYLWKGNVSQQAGAYNAADEDYVYAFIRGQGVIEYYKKGKYVATSNYNLRDEDDFEWAWEYMEIILQDICDRLIAYNKDVPDRMVYNSTDIEDVSAGDNPMSFRYKGRRIKLLTDGTGYAIYEKGEMIDYGFKSLEDAEAAIDEYDDIYQDDVQVYSATEEDDGEGYIEASSDDSIMFEGNNYEYVTNNDRYWIYRAVIDGKGVWRAMPQGSDESEFSRLSFPISYDQARGFEPINEPSAITKLRKDLGKKLLPKSGQSIEATEDLTDLPENFQHAYTLAKNDFMNDYISSGVEVYVATDDFNAEDGEICLIVKGINRVGKPIQGKVYVDIDQDADEIYQALDETAEAIGMIDDDIKSSSAVNAGAYMQDDSIVIDAEDLKGYSKDEIKKILDDAPVGSEIIHIRSLSNRFNLDSYIEKKESYKSNYNQGFSSPNDWKTFNTYWTVEGTEDPYIVRMVYEAVNGKNKYYGLTSDVLKAYGSDVDDVIEDPVYSGTQSYEYRLGDMVRYNGDIYVIIDDEDNLLTLRPYSRFSDDDFDDPESGDCSEDVFLEPWQLGKNQKVFSASEDDEDDLPMVDQEYDSAATSINSNKLPAIYKMVNFNEGDVVVDFGGGKFDNAVEYIKDKGATLVVYDPYNRSAEHNREVLRILRENGGADAAVNSNVLNVIKEPEARKNVLENIARITKPGAPIYITVYEGKGNGQEGPTKSGYQLNRKTADYLEEIQEVFPDATRRGKLITAHNSGSVSSSINIQAANNPSYEKYLLNQVRSLLIGKLESEYDIEFFITDMYIDGDDMHIQVYGDDALHGDVDIPVDYSGDVYDFADDAFNKLKDIFQNNSSNTVEGSQDISRYDKEIVSYREIISKSVEDNDDFLTDYTMYEVVTEDGSVEYECYFGDNDLYGPWNGEGLDFEADNYDEAVEWYNNYGSDEIESSQSIEADAFSSLEDEYLSPPEYDDPIEHEDSQELIEVELDQVITVDVDGDYEWDDDTYVWASPDGSNEEWRSEDGVYIDDKVGVVEHIDDLITPNVPTRPGKYRVTGLAKLIYDVSGIQEYRTNYGPDDYESDLDMDHAVVSFNFSKSSVENLKITPVRR